MGVCVIPEPSHRRYKAHREFGDRREKVISSRTYFYEGEEQCDKNMNIFLESIDGVAGKYFIIKFSARSYHGRIFLL